MPLEAKLADVIESLVRSQKRPDDAGEGEGAENAACMPQTCSGGKRGGNPKGYKYPERCEYPHREWICPKDWFSDLALPFTPKWHKCRDCKPVPTEAHHYARTGHALGDCADCTTGHQIIQCWKQWDEKHPEGTQAGVGLDPEAKAALNEKRKGKRA